MNYKDWLTNIYLELNLVVTWGLSCPEVEILSSKFNLYKYFILNVVSSDWVSGYSWMNTDAGGNGKGRGPTLALPFAICDTGQLLKLFTSQFPHLQNKEKWYRWTCLQGRNRDTDVENKCMDTKGGREGGGMNWEIGIDIYTLICI